MIPKIDSEIGISVYSTNFAGCGGKIRVNEGDFKVSELLSEKSMSMINQDDGYAVYKLKKRNIDTHHALESIFRKTRLKLKSLGLKDSSAITEQFVCSMNKSKSIDTFSTSKYSLDKIGFLKKPFSKKDMVGNHFTIKITDASSEIIKFNEHDKILNFFGYQRFGSKRPVNHLVGKAILQTNFEKAVELLLSFSTTYDSSPNIELRTKLADKSNYSSVLRDIPPQMDFERTLVKEMIQHDDPKRAFRAIPISLRRFFIQAYQSFLFNKTLSMAFEDGEDMFSSQEGDICYDKNGLIGKFDEDLDQKLAVPLIGFSYYKKTRFHHQISKILEDEEIKAKNFFVKDLQEVSNEGGFRNSSVICTNFSISDNIVSFTLSRGSFATIVLREIIKPDDPLLVGF